MEGTHKIHEIRRRLDGLLKSIGSFWGLKEDDIPPPPKVAVIDEPLYHQLAGNTSRAAYLPSERHILLPRKEVSEKELVAELAHYLRHAITNYREDFSEYTLAEEFFERLTLKGLGKEEKFPHKVLRWYEAFGLGLLKSIVDTYNRLERAEQYLHASANKIEGVEDTVRKEKVLKAHAKSLELIRGEKQEILRILKNFVAGKSIELSSILVTLPNARNIARFFLDETDYEKTKVDRLIDLVRSGEHVDVDNLINHWSYLLAEFHAERVLQMDPRERRLILENLRSTYPELLLQYVEHREPELAAKIRHILEQERKL